MYVISPRIKRPPFADLLAIWYACDGIQKANASIFATNERWNERAGSGIYLIEQGGGAATFYENRFKSRPSVYISGSSSMDYLTATSAITSIQNGEIFIVIRPNLATSSNVRGIFHLGGRYSAPKNGVVIEVDNSATRQLYFHIANAGSVDLVQPSVTFANGLDYLIHAKFTASGITLYLNGAQVATTPRTVATIGYVTTYGGMAINKAAGSVGSFTGDYPEVVVLNGNIDTAGKTMMERYFNEKYAIF